MTGLSVIVELRIACTAGHFCGQDIRLKCALKYKKKIKIKILLKHLAFDYKGLKKWWMGTGEPILMNNILQYMCGIVSFFFVKY